MHSIANSTSYMFLDINPSKYIKIYTIQKTLPKQEILKISLFAPLPLPAPNSIVLEEWVSSISVDRKFPTNEQKEFNKQFEDTSKLLLLI